MRVKVMRVKVLRAKVIRVKASAEREPSGGSHEAVRRLVGGRSDLEG